MSSETKFLKNVWYCAGWAEELNDDALVGRKILGKHLMLYRKQNGDVVAVDDACPHRFAPLHQGKRIGDNVQCPYHGLEFGPTGECTKNPHGSGVIPKACKIQDYPMVERHNALWIWMGDAEKANPDHIPDFSMTVPREGWATVYGNHSVKAGYELVVDNLLDRSHVQYLHPLLIQENLPDNYSDEHSTEVQGDVVWDYHAQYNCPKVPFLNMVWPEAPDFTEQFFNVRWEAPGNMLLDAGMSVMGSNREVGFKVPSANLITPADENETHYFWNQCRNMRTQDPELDKMIHAGVSKTFAEEDAKIIEDSLPLMGGSSDLMSLKPVLLDIDEASMRCRRIIASKIAAEQG